MPPRGRANQALESYYRIAVPYILKNYEKVIFTDCDMLARSDIAPLLDIDISDSCIAAAPDAVWQGLYVCRPFLQAYCENDFPIKDPYKYINADLLVFNLEKCRETISQEEMLQLAQSRNFLNEAADVLNLAFEGQIKELDFIWNYPVETNARIRHMLAYDITEEMHDQYLAACEAPHLLHFAGKPKPWEDPDIEFGFEWWKTAMKSPFIGSIIRGPKTK